MKKQYAIALMAMTVGMAVSTVAMAEKDEDGNCCGHRSDINDESILYDDKGEAVYDAESGSYETTNGVADEAEFGVSMTLVSKIEVNRGSDLCFETSIKGDQIDVTTSPESADAAVFSMTGDRYADIQVMVVEEQIYMTVDGGNTDQERILVDSWTYGGSVDEDGRGTTDANGILDNIRVGGTAHVMPDNVDGDYEGNATIRIVYDSGDANVPS